MHNLPNPPWLSSLCQTRVEEIEKCLDEEAHINLVSLIAGMETTIAMTPSSRKSMVAQFFETEEDADESEAQDNTVSVESESDEPRIPFETTIAMTPSSRKSMVAKFFEDEQNESQAESKSEIEVQVERVKRVVKC